MFLPVNQAMRSSKDAIKDVTKSSLFVFTSITMKFIAIMAILFMSFSIGVMFYTFIYYVSIPIDI